MIFSAWGALFFLEKLATFFSRRPQILKTHAKTANHSHPKSPPPSKNFLKNRTLALPGWGALTTFLCKLGPQFFSPPCGGGGARAPSAPSGYAYAFVAIE